jgi:hypothetical protein
VQADKECYQIALEARFQYVSFLAGARLWYVRPWKPQAAVPFHIYGTRVRRTSIDATDFLRRNDRMASLLPAATRMASLQKDVRLILPPMYANCEALSIQDGVLTLAVPSSAVAAKLKQQTPKLQAALQKKGWQVDSVRIKIQVGRALPAQDEVMKPSSLKLPPTAVQAFEELGDALAGDRRRMRPDCGDQALEAEKRKPK